ncbi:N-acyl-D-amino-acid deacylase family protein [Paracidobacterium acidisoli]|uniref:D-aminoacylase n=1 Tax=Paracidobacterium acidisoli TaxID=2303751 RepID=A0A372IJV6_9BACT|nr:D-aminoacylase [Paracidobacterium acidisoli]MBT9333094.1 D-aminoacylase [Paracidobacterium acidisoli]
MRRCDTLIRNANLLDGSGTAAERMDVALSGDLVCDISPSLSYDASSTIDAHGLTLAPGFIDVHTHDDTSVIRNPGMLPKLSQGVTTVIVGNCGISAAPVQLQGEPPDPMNLLGGTDAFRYPTFAAYVAAVEAARPAVNVGALVGHTALRNNHMDRLDRTATEAEVAAMRRQLEEALACGALGLSTGLAYLSANAASTEEVVALAEPLASAGAVYTTHMRSETETILDAMHEAFEIGRLNRIPVIVSHLKCAGIANWGRSGEVLEALDAARASQHIGCDCYPYAAGSSTLDLRQVDERVKITITWSTPHPEAAGQTLAEIAAAWNTTQPEAARRLQPAGAIYHSISEEDMRRILQHPATMIGSDGLPNDPRPHPRLWGTFPRVLGRYSREEKLLSLPEAIHKMTGMPAQRFGLAKRGLIRQGYYADLVLFDPDKIIDTATFSDPVSPSKGIAGVWVNGVLSFTDQGAAGKRNGRFLSRGKTTWVQ